MSSPDQIVFTSTKIQGNNFFFNFLTCSDNGSDYDNLVLLMYDTRK